MTTRKREEYMLERGKYFVKKAFCLITHQIPSSKELNKLNLFMRKACTQQGMVTRFEHYVSRIIFRIPLPERSFAKRLRIHLPGVQS